MGRFGEADGVPPLYVVELAHEIRAALNDPKVRQKAASEAHAALERQNELGYGAEGDCEQWHRKLAKDWPFPIEHGIDEPPGCILALVALNDFAASKPELFGRPSAVFKPVADSWAPLFDWSWRRMVDELRPEHEAKIRSVVDSALYYLGPATVAARRSKRGRKPQYDPKEDAKLDRDWKAANAKGSTKAEFAKSKGKTLKEVNLALGRVRGWKSRAQEKPRQGE
ncbi:hypothetical protein [Lacipirellula limnantheis]|uniref:Uncharacterized protein n=1 Tax=Lacipirellula limnantheis TaxID=2528024 RepID=A0A517TV48_9BACT|nr:hypothetical protein [Lacipirellula limnantheis]QDT72227.1 hypothetical protein I41_13980 [Lacipirellula limnantheis]